jgi:hypothetical protein
MRSDKEPISGALIGMTFHLKSVVDGLVAAQKAPIPEDRTVLTRHIKELAYFLRTDAVGICELPPYAVFTHRFPNGEPVELKHKYAIAILIDQDWQTAEASSGSDFVSRTQSFLALSPASWLTT